MILIGLTFSVATLAAVLQLVDEHPSNEVALARGPILAVGLVWYLISNYLCANAVYLYPVYLPTPVKMACWLGLVGGGLDCVLPE